MKSTDIANVVQACRTAAKGRTPEETATYGAGVAFPRAGRNPRRDDPQGGDAAAAQREAFRDGMLAAFALLAQKNADRCTECGGEGYVQSDEGDCPTCSQPILVTCPKCVGKRRKARVR